MRSSPDSDCSDDQPHDISTHGDCRHSRAHRHPRRNLDAPVGGCHCMRLCYYLCRQSDDAIPTQQRQLTKVTCPVTPTRISVVERRGLCIFMHVDTHTQAVASRHHEYNTVSTDTYSHHINNPKKISGNTTGSRLSTTNLMSPKGLKTRQNGNMYFLAGNILQPCPWQQLRFGF